MLTQPLQLSQDGGLQGNVPSLEFTSSVPLTETFSSSSLMTPAIHLCLVLPTYLRPLAAVRTSAPCCPLPTASFPCFFWTKHSFIFYFTKATGFQPNLYFLQWLLARQLRFQQGSAPGEQRVGFTAATPPTLVLSLLSVSYRQFPLKDI